MVFNFRRKETMTSTSQLPILQVDALRKTYRKLVAVRDISFAVYPQQVFCLVGPNGAGKTSVIDCIVGLKKPDGGDVHLFGERVSNLQRRNDIRSRIGIQFQEDSLYNDIRVKEALRLYASMHQNPVDPAVLMDDFELQRQEKTAYKNLSGGEKRRLLIAIALVGNPALLILDEPSSNLDPHLRRQLWDVLNRYRRQGLTIVMTTHNMREAQQYSDVVCVVNRGQIVASGSVPQLLEKFHLNLKVEVNAEVNPKAIADCPNVTHVDANAQGTCIYGDNEAFQAAVIERLNDLGIHQFAIKNSDLEDVYLFATGRRYMRYDEKNDQNEPGMASDALFVEGKTLLQNAVDTSDIDQLYEARERFERGRAAGDREALALYYLALCEYRLITVFDIAHSEKGRCINRAIKYLKNATKLMDTFADAHAFLAIFYFQKMGMKPYLGVVLGPLSTKIVEKSKRLEGDNPRVVMSDAINDYYTPPMFGGNKDQAIAKIERAVELFSKEGVRDAFQPAWGHDEAYILMGFFRQGKGDIEGAREAFISALEVNPNNDWIKFQLLPGLANKSSKENP